MKSTLKSTLIYAARALVRVQESRLKSTCLHSQRVAYYALLLARELRLDEKYRKHIYLAGLLHDIGKIGIPDFILFKRGKLTAEEWEEIKKHPVFSYEILSTIPGMKEISLMVLHHHERYDGTGYPVGLASQDIPLGARILAVADSFDAMTSERVYRPFPLSREEAMKEMHCCAGGQFDPLLVEVFSRLVGRGETDLSLREFTTNFNPESGRI